MYDLTDKVAIVTGAGRGMGKAHSIALAAQGAKVAVTDIDIRECQRVAEEIFNNDGKAVAYKMDVARKSDIESVFDAMIDQFGRIDILINNAGIFTPKPSLDIMEEEWDKMIDINLKGQFLCAQRAAKEMSKNKWGRIINIASIASGGVGVGFSGGAHYTASKGGIIGLSETLAIEWAMLGITVNVIAPGAINTAMVSSSQMSKEVMDGLLAGIPLHRMGEPEEVAAAAVFLASEEAQYVTGATLYVDGGWTAQ